MYPFTVEHLSSAIGGKLLHGRRKRRLQGPNIHFMVKRRKVTRRYLRWLTANKKTCLIVPPVLQSQKQSWRGKDISVIEVPDCRQSVQSAAIFLRENLRIPIIQVSGSAGKSTTKEMVGAVLHSLNPVISFTDWNAIDGISYNLLRITTRHKAAVLEAGMNGAGQLREISRLLRPDILIITSIQREHYLRLGSLENIVAAKAEALEHMQPDGLLVVNGEDPNCAKLPAQSFPGHVLRFGFSDGCDTWATNIAQKGFHTYFVAHHRNFSTPCWIATFGKYNVGNALAALCVGHYLGLSPEVMATDLAKFRPLEGRLKVHRGNQGRRYINDWYNANPDSTAALLQALVPLARKHQLLLVLGDQERPDAPEGFARKLHFQIGQQVAALRPAYLLVIGKWAAEYARGAASAGFPGSRIAHFQTIKEAKVYLPKYLRPGQLVVFKASQFIHPDENLRFSNRELVALV